MRIFCAVYISTRGTSKRSTQAIFNPNLRAFSEFLDIVEKHGTPDEINAKATEAGKLSNLEAMVERIRPEYLADL